MGEGVIEADLPLKVRRLDGGKNKETENRLTGDPPLYVLGRGANGPTQ